MKKWIYLVLVIAVCVLPGCSRQEGTAVEGKPAPDFALKDLSGNQRKLSDFKGQLVMVNFWATWCPPCREEIPSMVKLNQMMAGKPFQMLAISIDEGGAEAVTTFFKKTGVMLPALLDTDHAVSKRYGTTGVPETFVINSKGVIVKKVVGALDWSSPDVVKALDEIAKQ